MVRRSLCLALAVCALSVLASAADARTAHDPCQGDGFSLQRENGQPQRACNRRFHVPPHRTMVDPAGTHHRAGETCPDGYRIPGSTGDHGGRFPSDWDYWTHNGEWVTWNLYSLSVHATNTDGTRATGLSGYYPYVHNWGSWNWGARSFAGCEPIGSGLVAPVAMMARTTLAEPAPDVRQGDDADNVIHDGAGSDELVGGPGDDTMTGGAGDDVELGGTGADHLSGGPGDDELFDDHGKDILEGGPGNDRFSARDGNHDVIDCGPGEDIAIGDAHDTYVDCEHAYRSPADDPAHPPHVG